MDGRHFDALMRTLTETGTRRGLFGLLAILPGLRGFFALLAPDDSAATGRRTRSVGGENHKRGGRRRKHKPHKKLHPRCKAAALTKTCAGRCGQVRNNCKKTVDCGSCVCGDVCESGCPFPALQAAVDAANSGDTIRLCAGTYLGVDAIANIDKDLTIIGAGDGPDSATNTILDGDGGSAVPVGVLRIANGRVVSLRGLRITGGSEGGVRNDGTLTMANCTVIGNSVGSSGTVAGVLSDGPLTMTDCTVSENTAPSGNAGGVRIHDAFSLIRCTIRENRGGVGGLLVQGTGTLTETTIMDNTGLVATLAGGLYTDLGTTTLIDSTISGNTPRNCAATNMGTITGPGCAP